MVASVLCDLLTDNEIQGSQLQLVGLLCCPVQKVTEDQLFQKPEGSWCVWLCGG